MLDHIYYLRRAVEVSRRARAAGNTPFGAILVDAGGNILAEQENIEITEKICTGHAECTLAARASHRFDRDFLWTCTLYSTAEPCAMCTGAIYWANIGTIVYGIEEAQLLAMTGPTSRIPLFPSRAGRCWPEARKTSRYSVPFRNCPGRL